MKWGSKKNLPSHVAVVAAYVSTGSFQIAAEIQDIILQTFRDDIRKYTKVDLQIENLEKLLGSGIKHVGKHVKYSKLLPEVGSQAKVDD